MIRREQRSSVLYARAAVVALLLSLTACGTVSQHSSSSSGVQSPDVARSAPPRSTGGGYYLNDGPGDNPPANLDQVPDAVPKAEPLRTSTMRPYTVMGQDYKPLTSLQPYKARGIASWYGRRYHGQKTASGEIYDMYTMTAAHPTLPIPSYARVTNVANNKSVIVRINDRGPFYTDRLIDLSYTAAYKLGVLGGGRATVDVESIMVDSGTPTTPTVASAPPTTNKPLAPLISSASIDTPPVPSIPTTVAPAITAPLPDLPAANPEPIASIASAANAVETSAPAPVLTIASEQKGLFLQLGAFSSEDNAANYMARLRSQVTWLAPTLQVYPNGGLYRVHAGPYASQAEARAAADQLSQTLGIKAIVLTR